MRDAITRLQGLIYSNCFIRMLVSTVLAVALLIIMFVIVSCVEHVMGSR